MNRDDLQISIDVFKHAADVMDKLWLSFSTVSIAVIGFLYSDIGHFVKSHIIVSIVFLFFSAGNLVAILRNRLIRENASKSIASYRRIGDNDENIPFYKMLSSITAPSLLQVISFHIILTGAVVCGIFLA
jgi:hypothetical protein